MLRFKAKITPNKTATKTAKKKCFLVFSTSQNKLRSDKSHIINPLLTSFVRSVRQSIAFGFYRTDLRQYFPVQTSHSVNKSLVSCTTGFISSGTTRPTSRILFPVTSAKSLFDSSACIPASVCLVHASFIH